MRSALIIDDQPDMLNLMAAVLRRIGFEVTTAESGNYVVHEHLERNFDIVITDIFMPDTDGLEVIRELRRSNPDMPVLAVSGGSARLDRDFLRVAKLLGADRVLKKPFRPDELKSAVLDCFPAE